MRDLERLPGGTERMTQMVHMRAFWLGMMRAVGLRVVRDDSK